MKKGPYILGLIIVIILAVICLDQFYISKLEKKFLIVEKERVVVSNKLATAKIVYENLNHVRDLVFKNMDFPGQTDTVTLETRFFDYITTCVNDLKLKLVSVEPLRPVTQDRVTIFGYNIQIEGDFFSLGELCSKLENSRRIISLESFTVEQISDYRPNLTNRGGIRVQMLVHTYRIKKI
jgi:Tfp pilus assembly protein PilO